MESVRSGSGLPTRPIEGTARTRRMGDPRNTLSPPRPLNLTRTGKESDIPRTIPKPSPSSGSRPASRVPQPSSRRPSIPQPTTRPALNHQAQSWASSSTIGSSRSSTKPRGGSGSSSSARSIDTTSKPAPNVLRRKKSSLSSGIASPNNESPRTSSSSTRRSRGPIDLAFGIHMDRSLTHSPAEIQVAEVVDMNKSGKSQVIYPELDRYRDVRRPSNSSETNLDVPFRIATHDLPPPTPASLLFSGTSGSPSTRFSESPGPGPYSRDTTPTSIASQSPSFVTSFRANPVKGRLNSPSYTRPPVTRRRAGSIPNEVDSITADPHGLAAVRESLNSSSSNSTVRESDRTMKKEKAKRLPPPPPSPPPRKSSHQFSQGQNEFSPVKTVRKVSRPLMTSPSPERIMRPSPGQTHLSPKAGPPSRPSRDGTPDIHSQLFGPVPIIHSNLSTQSLPTERRGSDVGISSSLPRTSNQLSDSDRVASTSRLPIGGEAASRSRSRLNADPTKTSNTELPRLTRTPSPNVATSFSRFAFFGRKKVPTDGNQTEKKEKEKKKIVRKGPVAGTGHEGYGRIGGIRRRSGSISNIPRGSSGTQFSQDNATSSDPFLADRMNPVIIAGGAIVENRNASSELSRTDSYQSLTQDQPKQSSDSLSAPQQGPRNTLWPSPMSRTPNPAFGYRRPSDSSDSEGVTMKSTLAFRRSVQRLRSSPDDPLRLPQPINTSETSTSPMTSFDMSVMSDESHFELQREISRDAKPVQPAPKKLTKRSRSPRKWNLFGRSQNNQNSKKNEPVAATVKVVEKKPVPFYAMMDSSEQEDSEPMDVQEVLRRAEVYGKSPSLSGTPDMTQTTPEIPEIPEIPQPSTRTPPQPEQPIRREVPKPSSKARLPLAQPVSQVRPAPQILLPPSTSTEKSGRRSRLPQVGRIPKVVNRSDHLSPKSFSRPFRASLTLPPRASAVYDAESIAKGPSPPKPSTPMPELTMEGSTIESGTNISSHDSNSAVSPEQGREKEFIAFSPRKDSHGTIGTSSSSCSAVPSFSEATAVIPNPSDPPAEDEVWDEYDDLLGEDQVNGPKSASSSKGTPFHLETYHSKLAKGKPMESPTIVFDTRKASTHSRATTGSSTYSGDMTERIRAAFQPHPSPSTPFSVSEFVAGYRGRNNSVDVTEEVSESQRSSRSSRKDRKSDASTSSDDSSPLAQVNLRVGSMTVSKWLTFGHVLFSDVRHELVPVEGSLKRHSILVIDGLGNDDWSFYAAETYPAATFFNLSPRAPLPAELQNSASSFPLSPPNHHQIQYVSHLDKFPFAPQSFTAVVYRFPVAAPESYYRNILTEARRVLKPGGYIELSILDVDLNNMGNRGRRVVRRLKERVNEKTPDTNLASTADLIVRLLGKVGFSTIKAARVGVPAASSVTRSDSRKAKDPEEKKKDQPSLAEMMSDNGPLADEGITRMVGRVGRWWYTRCYENAAENPSGKSIWADRALLSECEELGTSLKLTVCCARAPDRITSF